MTARILLIGMLALLGSVQKSADAAGGQTQLSKVEIIKHPLKPGLAGLPANAPRPMLYFLANQISSRQILKVSESLRKQVEAQ